MSWNGTDSLGIALDDGFYYLRVSPIDSELPATTQLMRIGIDTTPPQIASISPATGNDLPRQVNSTFVVSVAISTNQSANVSGIKAVILKLQQQGDTIATEYELSPELSGNTFSYDFAAATVTLRPGTHSFIFAVSDSAGNTRDSALVCKYSISESAGAAIAEMVVFSNPYHPGHGGLTVSYNLGSDHEKVTLEIFNSGRRLIAKSELTGNWATAGVHDYLWDGVGTDGQVVGNGVYFCRIEAGGDSEVVKLLVIHR
jgi:hypothetical protein